MSEIANKVADGYKPPSPEVQAAVAMPIEQLESQIKAMESGNEATPPNPGQTPTQPESTPVQAQSVQVPEGTIETKPADTPTPPVEVAKVGEATFEQIAQKKGFTNPDQLAKAYANLEREFHKKKQDESVQNRLPAMPTQIPATPVNGESNFLNALLEQPEQTIANAFLKLNSIVNADQVDKINTLQRRLKFEEMASNPETADFADPEIQAQMQEEFKARPAWMGSVNDNLEDAYYIARGKVKFKAEQKAFEQGRTAGQQAVVAKIGATAEGSSPATPQVVKDSNPMTMPITDLERMLKEKSR